MPWTPPFSTTSKPISPLSPRIVLTIPSQGVCPDLYPSSMRSVLAPVTVYCRLFVLPLSRCTLPLDSRSLRITYTVTLSYRPLSPIQTCNFCYLSLVTFQITYACICYVHLVLQVLHIYTYNLGGNYARFLDKSKLSFRQIKTFTQRHEQIHYIEKGRSTCIGHKRVKGTTDSRTAASKKKRKGKSAAYHLPMQAFLTPHPPRALYPYPCLSPSCPSPFLFPFLCPPSAPRFPLAFRS